MMKFISIFVGKVALFFLKLLHRGSSFPGVIALKLNKNILKQFKMPNTIICVTGSSGKGTTTKIINDVYKDLGYTVAYNSKGSNQVDAIVTTLIENSTLTGIVKTDICVFEIDERYTKSVFPKIKPTHVVITNVTRDQPPRQRHFDFVFTEIKKALNKDIHLILNGDDPYLRNFNLDNEYNVTYYGIDKLKYSLDESKFNCLNTYRCPKCLKPLKYNYYHIEHIGDYYCSSCDFKKPKEEYKITTCDFDKNKIKINKSFEVSITNNMLYNLYNTLAAFTTLAINDIDLKEICKSISKINNNDKIFKAIKFKTRDVYTLNNKAENSSTYNQSILFTSRDNDLKTIILGWKEISRRYNYDDVSWLYDIDFELLTSGKVDKIICTGPQKYDLATRLKYAGFNEKKIKVYYDLFDAKDEIKKSKGTIYAILNFDYLKPFEEVMEELK